MWQPWASLIMAGVKPYEFRRWDYRTRERNLEGTRIVIHAGARPPRAAEIAELMHTLGMGDKGTGLRLGPALDLLEGWWRNGRGNFGLPLASALGTVVLGEPREASKLFAGDSDRVDEHVWAWPVSDPLPFQPIVPAKGWQGFWTWNKPYAVLTPEGLRA